jgi:hypothetical protein
MKRVLVDFKGSVQAIANPGEEFEVYEGPDAAVRWVNCNDDSIDASWVLVNGEWLPNVQAPPSYEVLRKQAYGDVGEQLDMLYKDMVNGTSNWVEHVQMVKETVPGPNSDEAREIFAARPAVNWNNTESPAWTDASNRSVPGLLHVVGIKDTVIEISDQNQ